MTEPFELKPAAKARSYGPLVIVLVLVLLAGLPIAAWLDMRALSDRLLARQSDDISRVINDMRNFYASDVVGRVLSRNVAVPTHNYKDVDGGIPIPATLSIELGKQISARNDAVQYRFVSDYPFAGRGSHTLDDFEMGAIKALRADPKTPQIKVTGDIFDRAIRLATPVFMGQACVNCHNKHPESPKKDWKVGDVRGIQEITIHQPIGDNIFAFKYLMAYFAAVGAVGVTFLGLQRKQTKQIRGVNQELTEANDFLATVSMKIAKYISPQIYKSIFSGQRDVQIATERKRLTIFFSDIKDFTATTERLQPEDLTALLNEYFTEMSAIALKHGATVDKFIGDAMLLFFGDPETKGAAEDARACLEMAVEMQTRLAELNNEWRRRGIEQPFRARMGINTGYCNVGNFGSEDRMDYTIIGAEANLAARLQTIAEPGGIVMSYETYALVREVVRAHPLDLITMKGISREVVPYAVDGLLQDLRQRKHVISEHATGIELFLDLDVIDPVAAARTRRLLENALAALNEKTRTAGAA
ncbi:adenylate/guanylate cyclase domain-containing protein [Pseudorhodoplanes sinuspersici]|uniref:Adenylate/guanylate cyclase domain-containing protein n=1 Tax=Pseudorhodoplanes sinuspersici TaxID=1235591 RepID=A0A1W6ZRR3_9HYPH|nr:adenylate/guanylate cyclase domain-containing protein [Pseudorhodoplanes sinuspersici]ARQ00077.1 adenylate/guanylate cyclase domain-containing protein [Pseudorhodoplanes sinuspersici]RKE71119.1 class 3 adenylate cyclase [Pseudorhodoplanes sinuspersici]